MRSSLLLALVFLFALACSDDSPAQPPPTFTLPPNGEVHTVVTPEPTETPVPPPRLQRLPFGSPITEPGSYILDTETGAVTKVASSIGHHALSPDDRYLVIRNCCDTGMGVLDLVSGQFRQLNTPNPNEVIWDHRGDRLFFTVSDPVSEAGVYVVNRDGTGLKRLATQAYASDLHLFAQDEVGFKSGEPSNEARRYFTVDLPTSTITERLPTDPISLNDPRILFGDVSVSGDWVVFREEFTAYAWNAQTQELRLLGDNVTQLRWAPNRDQLLVDRYGGVYSSDTVVLFDLRSGMSMPMTELGLWSQWTNDGSRIISSGYRCDRTAIGGASGQADVLVHEVAAGRTTLLTSTPDKLEYEIAVAPSRNQAVFVTKGTTYELNLVNLSQLTTQVGVRSEFDIHVHDWDRNPWSPDGRYLQFHVSGGHGICE